MATYKFNVRTDIKRTKGNIRTAVENITNKTSYSAAVDVAYEAVKNLSAPKGPGRMTPLSRGKGKYKDFPHIATGKLMQSYQITRTHNKVEVAFTDPKAASVNYGEGPGYYVSQKALEAWAMQKFPRLASDPKRMRHFVITVQRRIRRNGLRPTLFFTNAVKEVRRKVKAGTRLMTAEKGIARLRQADGSAYYANYTNQLRLAESPSRGSRRSLRGQR